MSIIPKRNSSQYPSNKFKKKLITNEENKEQNIQNSLNSTHIFSNKNIYFKQESNHNSNNYKKIDKYHSSIHITQFKKFSKFKKDKKMKSDKRLNSKFSSSKLLTLLQNSKKTKKNKKVSITETIEANEKTKNEDIEPKKIRYDNYGNIINKKNKKNVHIVFADQFSEKSITEEIQIESFKKFNYIIGLSEDDIYKSSNPLNKCCSIF